MTVTDLNKYGSVRGPFTARKNSRKPYVTRLLLVAVEQAVRRMTQQIDLVVTADILA